MRGMGVCSVWGGLAWPCRGTQTPPWQECTGFPLAILASRMVYTCTVLDAVTDPVGKWPAALGNVVALDVSALQVSSAGGEHVWV